MLHSLITQKLLAAYDGNNNAYDELIFRVPLNEKINHSVKLLVYWS
jgi:hypothetical protein